MKGIATTTNEQNRAQIVTLRFSFFENPFSIIDDFDMWFYVATQQAFQRHLGGHSIITSERTYS